MPVRLLVVVCCIVCLGHLSAVEGDAGFGLFGEDEPEAEADDTFALPEDDEAEAPAEPAEGAAAPAPPEGPLAPVRRLSNRALLAAVHDFTAKRKLPTTTYGDGAFRILAIGGTPPDPEQLVADGELVLGGLDQWTGKQGLFAPDAGSDDQVLWYVLLKDDATFDAFLEHGRKAGVLPTPEGEEDLSKQTNNSWASRAAVTEIGKISNGGIHRNITVYLATGLALRTFIAERSPEAPGGSAELPKWLVAGMQSELEKRICGSNRCYTISYEKSSVDLGQQDWGKAMAKLIKDRSPRLVPAGDVMLMDLVSTPPEHYLQLWSLSAFVREAAGPGKRGKPGFAELLDRIARGESADDAIYDQLGSDNRALTAKWLRWASSPR